jgi:hypothetical protein
VIKNVTLGEIGSPFKLGIERPRYWPFSPFLFRDDFLHTGFYPFEDQILRTEDVATLFTQVWCGRVFRMPWATYAKGDEAMEIYAPSKSELAWIDDQLFHDAAIYWTDDGEIFAHYHSDFCLTNFSNKTAQTLWNQNLHQYFMDSENCFTNPGSFSKNLEFCQAIKVAMVEYKKTWTDK